MQKTLVLKLVSIGVLAFALLLAIALIRDIVRERQQYRDQVIADVARSWTGQQKISGIVLAVPYSVKVEKKVDQYADGEYQSTRVTEHEPRVKYLLPAELEITGTIDTEERYRGIYRVPVYTAHLNASGRFELPARDQLLANEDIAEIGTPFLVIGVTDTRGLTSDVALRANGQMLEPEAGSDTPFIGKGIHAKTTLADLDRAQMVSFDTALTLQGMQSLTITPVGKRTRVSLTSPWPHPQFVGSFLPKTRSISDKGFTAEWETTHFASGLGHAFERCTTGACKEFDGIRFGVSLINGVDIYLKSERSLKYAVLFIGLTFGTFFFFEIIKALPIHPIQYGLVGGGLAIFYLLLISLSEHVGFDMAYAMASAGSVGLLGFYLVHVLHSLTRGLAFAGALSAIYGALYMLVRSEDYALVMGSGLLFGALALVIVATRNVDWYKVAPVVQPMRWREERAAAPSGSQE